MLGHRIIETQQPTDHSCVHACISMVTGVPVEDIIDEYSLEDEGMALDQEHVVVDTLGYFHITYHAPVVLQGRVFLVTVPSMNIVGNFHRIVIDARVPDNPHVYDPNKGRKGKLCYNNSDIGKIGWLEVTEIINKNLNQWEDE